MVLFIFYYLFIAIFSAGGLYSDVKSNNPMVIDYVIYGILVLIFPFAFPFVLGEYISEKTNFF